MKINYYLARRIIFSSFVSVALIAFGAALSAASALDKYSALINEAEVYSVKSVSTTTEVDECFLVREHEGIIGVFTSDGEYLYAIEVYVKTLPEADRALLASGIHAKNKAELLEILGDYNA